MRKAKKNTQTLKHSAFNHCLQPLLAALHWAGDERHLAEHMPHFSDGLDLASFRRVMQNLRYESSAVKGNAEELDSRLFPCLFISKNGGIFVILSQDTQGNYLVFDGVNNQETTYERFNREGIAYVFKKEDELNAAKQEHWFKAIAKDHKKLVFHSLYLSLVATVLSIATPLFIMETYDQVITAKSLNMLASFFIGVMIALLGMGILYIIRTHILSYIGARLDRDIGDIIFERLLHLPPNYTETATIGSQVARIRDFDNVRELLTSSFITTLFDPFFSVVFLIVIACLAGTLAFIPLAMIILLLVMTLILRRRFINEIKHASASNTMRQEFLLESVNKIRTIKYTASQQTWCHRFSRISAEAAMDNLKSTVTTSLTNTLADIVMIASGTAVLAFGVAKIFASEMSIGALIAVMILVWRVIAPFKTLFVMFPRLEQLCISIKQINQLMQLTPESDPGEIHTPLKQQFTGNISFNRVSLRYNQHQNPALIGVSFDVKAGESIAVVGRDGAGKSTVLKLIPALDQPQAGSIRIDNLDIRQISPPVLRQSVAYVPKVPRLFYGSIAQNLRLANSIASDEQLHAAAEQAGILEDILALPLGFNTPIRDHSTMQLSSGFQQCLNLARAYLKDASILLLDDPANLLDQDKNDQFVQTIKDFRGKKTVLMVSHRPSHLSIVDRVFFIDQGQLVLQGPPSEVIPKIPKELL